MFRLFNEYFRAKLEIKIISKSRLIKSNGNLEMLIKNEHYIIFCLKNYIQIQNRKTDSY